MPERPPRNYGAAVTLFERIESRAAKAGRPALADVALALGFAIVCVISVNTQTITDELHEAGPGDLALAVLVAAPIAVRRRFPLSALSFSCVAIFVLVVSNAPEGATPLAVGVLVYSIAAWAPLPRAIAGLGILCSTLIALRMFGGHLTFVDVGFNFAMYAIVWAVGVAVRARRESTAARLREANERAEMLAQRSARAVAEERLRIAQELHDVVAHSISVIAVQAGVGTHFLDERPDESRAALEAIGRTSRATLGELRRLLGVLRGDDGDRSHAPAPTLDDLPALIEEMRALGLPITYEIDGEPDADHRAIEMSAYRVVQEALTNVVKHAGPTSRVVVRIDHRPDHLRVRIEDDGRGAAVPAISVDAPGDLPSGHHGLLGMRERVDVWGGELTSGPRPTGGFAVCATFPFEAAR